MAPRALRRLGRGGAGVEVDVKEPSSVPSRLEKPRVRQPGHTCPEIDDLIKQLEDLRKANSKLRKYGEEYERIAEEMFDLATEWESYAGELQGELDELKRGEERAA